MSNMSDVIGGQNVYESMGNSYTNDRFGNSNSAIYLCGGYLKVPPGVYFIGDYTIIAWINLKSFQTSARIIDFGVGENDNVVFNLNTNNYTIEANIYSGNTGKKMKEKINLKKIINLKKKEVN
jgi:hypothetical protein